MQICWHCSFRFYLSTFIIFFFKFSDHESFSKVKFLYENQQFCDAAATKLWLRDTQKINFRSGDQKYDIQQSEYAAENPS